MCLRAQARLQGFHLWTEFLHVKTDLVLQQIMRNLKNSAFMSKKETYIRPVAFLVLCVSGP